MYKEFLTKEEITIELIAIKKGQDYIVILTGGDSAHIGAVTLSAVRPSLNEKEVISSSTSVLCMLGHKEDVLAKRVSELISAKLRANVSLVCGIHIDKIKDHQFLTINELVDDLVNNFLDSQEV